MITKARASVKLDFRRKLQTFAKVLKPLFELFFTINFVFVSSNIYKKKLNFVYTYFVIFINEYIKKNSIISYIIYYVIFVGSLIFRY